MQRVLDGLNKRLTLTENMRAIAATVSDTGPADTEFTVTHLLGKTPSFYFYNSDRAGSVYDSRRAEWTETVMYLKCSTGNTALTIMIF